MTRRDSAFMAFMMLGAFLVVGQLYLILPLITVIAETYHVSQPQAVMAGTLFGCAYAAGFLIFGGLSDRLGRKRVIIGALLSTAFASLLTSQMSDYRWVLMCRMLQGLVSSAFPPAALSLVAEQLPSDKRPLGISLMSLAFLSAAPLLQFIVVISNADFTHLMLVLSISYLLVMLALIWMIKADEPRMQRHVSGSRSLFADRGLWIVWSVAATVLFSFVMFYSGAEYFAEAQGIDVQMLRLVGIIPVFLSLLAGSLIRKFGAPFVARLGVSLIALSLILAFVQTTSTWFMAAIIMPAGVAFSLPGLIGTTAMRADQSNRGLALAIYSFTLFLGASLAPQLGQVIAPFSATLFWLLPFCLTACGAIALNFIKL